MTVVLLPRVAPIDLFTHSRQALLRDVLHLIQSDADDVLIATEIEGTVLALQQLLQLRHLLKGSKS